jgi:hypothetical protein
MKRLIAIAASIIVNASVLGALEHNAYVAQTPEGRVYVTELGASKSMPTYAQADPSPRTKSL